MCACVCPCQPVFKDGFNAKNVTPTGVTLNMHGIVTSPLNFDEVWSIEWTTIPIMIRKQWESEIEHFAPDFPRPETMLEATAKDNIVADIAAKSIPKEVYGKDRKMKGFYPSVANSGSASPRPLH